MVLDSDKELKKLAGDDSSSVQNIYVLAALWFEQRDITIVCANNLSFSCNNNDTQTKEHKVHLLLMEMIELMVKSLLSFHLPY